MILLPEVCRNVLFYLKQGTDHVSQIEWISNEIATNTGVTVRIIMYHAIVSTLKKCLPQKRQINLFPIGGNHFLAVYFRHCL